MLSNKLVFKNYLLYLIFKTLSTGAIWIQVSNCYLIPTVENHINIHVNTNCTNNYLILKYPLEKGFIKPNPILSWIGPPPSTIIHNNKMRARQSNQKIEFLASLSLRLLLTSKSQDLSNPILDSQWPCNKLICGEN